MDNEVKDKYFLNYALFYALGVISLVPSHFFNTATDYWMYKFRNVSIPFDSNITDENRTELQASFSSSFSIVNSVGLLLFLLGTNLISSKIPNHIRINTALISMLLLFIVNMILVKIDMTDNQSGFFVITMVMAVLLSATAGLLLMSTFELSSKFPTKYTAALLSGQAISGILTALAQILAVSIDAGPENDAIIYFCIGILLLVLVISCYIYQSRYSKYYQFYATRNLIVERGKKFDKDDLKFVFGKVKWFLLAILVVLGSTIMLAPGVIALVVSVDKGNGNFWNDKLFVPVVTFFLYNLCDFIGRECGKFMKPNNLLIILGIIIVRLGFVPMLLLCNEQPRSHMPVVFGDEVYIVLVIVYAFTHGYFLNLCLLLLPSQVEDSYKPVATLIMVMVITVGVGACSFLSLLFKAIL